MIAPHGWIILDKPVGLGSTQAVAAVKRNLREAGYGKVGHGGTLDPLASGVLPIALGEATKLCGRMLLYDKDYEFTVRFGAETDTLDAEGSIVEQSDFRPIQAEVEAVLSQFQGAIAQRPPAYSALKVDGKRAYDRARAGETVELAQRQVYITRLFTTRMVRCGATEDEIAYDLYPDDTIVPRGELELDSMTFMASVSKGTYIRSLARDIARASGTFGYVTMLRRVCAGPFGLNWAISLDKLNEIGKGAPLEGILAPTEKGLEGIPVLNLSPDQARAVKHGQFLTGLALPDGVCWARYRNSPLALLHVERGNARVERGFNFPDAPE